MAICCSGVLELQSNVCIYMLQGSIKANAYALFSASWSHRRRQCIYESAPCDGSIEEWASQNNYECISMCKTHDLSQKDMNTSLATAAMTFRILLLPGLPSSVTCAPSKEVVFKFHDSTYIFHASRHVLTMAHWRSKAILDIATPLALSWLQWNHALKLKIYVLRVQLLLVHVSVFWTVSQAGSESNFRSKVQFEEVLDCGVWWPLTSLF